MKRRYFLLLPILFLAGCQPMRPPTPEGLKLINERTAQGTTQTKLEARPQPYPVKAGNVSIWDLKIFDIKDKENGMRNEWKNFAQLPQQPDAKVNNTQVLMNAWIISPDGTIFLPQKPTYKAYGSFVTDWTLPRPGAYELWVQYQPSFVADEGLTPQQIAALEASKKLKLETAHWNFVAKGEALPDVAAHAATSPATTPGALPIYNTKGALTGETAQLQPVKARAGQEVVVKWKVNGASIENPEIVAIGPDGKTLLHGVAASPVMRFPLPGKWRLWLAFTRDNQSFAAPVSLQIAP